MRCCLDIDGVLVNLVEAFLKVHQIDWNPYHDPENLGEYWFHKFLGMTWEEAWIPIDYNFWLNIPPMPDAKEILRLVEETFGKENVCFLTNPSGCTQAAAGKLEWIRRNHPEYHRNGRFLIGGAKEFCSGAWLVDDYHENVKLFGNRGIIVPRPWNSHHLWNTLDYLKHALSKVSGL